MPLPGLEPGTFEPFDCVFTKVVTTSFLLSNELFYKDMRAKCLLHFPLFVSFSVHFQT